MAPYKVVCQEAVVNTIDELYREYARGVEQMHETHHIAEHLQCTLSDYVAEGVADFWDIYAYAYKSLWLLSPYRHLQDTVLSRISIRNYQAILDLGCGPGTLLGILHTETLKTCRMIAVDASESMLRVARNSATEYAENISFCRQDISEKWQFLRQCSKFDRVMCTNVLGFVREPLPVIEKIWQTLKRGGRTVATVPVTGFNNGIILMEHCGATDTENWIGTSLRDYIGMCERAFGENIRGMFPILIIGICNHLLVHQRGGSGIVSTYTVEEFEELFRRAGFSVIACEHVYAGQTLLITAIKTV